MSPGMPQRTAVDQALDITRRMLEHAQTGNWDAVVTLEVQRRECMDRSTRDPVTTRKILEEIRALNDAVVALTEKQRQETAAELRKIQQGRRAVPAYENCHHIGFALK